MLLRRAGGERHVARRSERIGERRRQQGDIQVFARPEFESRRPIHETGQRIFGDDLTVDDVALVLDHAALFRALVRAPSCVSFPLVAWLAAVGTVPAH